MNLAPDAARLRQSRLTDLGTDVARNQRLRLRVGPLYADFSRQLVDGQALDTLLGIADQVGLDRFRLRSLPVTCKRVSNKLFLSCFRSLGGRNTSMVAIPVVR